MMERTPEEERIFRALSSIQTPDFDIEEAVRQRREQKPAPGRRPLPKAALLCACLLLALMAGAAAAGLSGGWAWFFGGVPEGAVTTVEVSQTCGDHTLTLEEAIVDRRGAVFLLALTRADGGAVDPEAALRRNTVDFRVLVDGVWLTGSMRDEEPVLSADGKTLYFCMEFRDMGWREVRSLLDGTITFQAGGVAKAPEEPLTGTVDLAPLGEREVPSLERERTREDAAQAVEQQDIALPLSQDHLFPQYQVRGAYVQDGTLAVVVSQGESGQVERSGALACAGVTAGALTDSRTGQQYLCTGAEGFPLSDGTWVMAFSFAGAGAEDLPYLTMSVGYRADVILAEGPFQLEFRAEQSLERGGAVQGLAAALPGGTVRLAGVRLSALYLDLELEGSLQDCAKAMGETVPVLLLRDGSRVETRYSSGSAREEGCILSFRVRDEEGRRVFLDPEKVEAVLLGDLEIPLEGNPQS